MPAIRVLPLSVVNQIAAGEVIERPASVVKELAENALDAGAASVTIELEDGGKGLVRVTDDGGGIPPEELPLAFAPHATSKLSGPEDLFNIHTLGFRGEALASIGSVAQVRLVSRPRTADSGHAIENNGGRIDTPVAFGAPVGTTVEVRNLFFNIPVRRRFLKTIPVELSHATETVMRLALANPTVRFDLLHEGQPVFRLPAAAGRFDRIAHFHGREVADNLLPAGWADALARVEAYAGRPALARATLHSMMLFLNGRYVRDRVLSRAVQEAYHPFIPHGRYPVCFLFLEVPPADVDVNVHPTKIEVRLRQVWRLAETLTGRLGELLRKSDPAPTVLPGHLGSPEFRSPGPGPAFEPTRTPFPGAAPPWRTPSPGQVAAALGAFAAQGFAPGHAPVPADPPAPAAVEALSAQAPGPAAIPSDPGASPAPRRFLQMRDSFLVEELADGLLIMDQHALHERVLYFEYQRRRNAGPRIQQRLLMPAVVELTPAQSRLAPEAAPVFRELGLDVAPFGENTLAVHAVPDFFGRTDPAELVRSVLDGIPSGAARGAREPLDAVLDRLIGTAACRAAVKAGDPLTPEAVARLLAMRARVEHVACCAHGRPTSLKVSWRELERYFQRT